MIAPVMSCCATVPAREAPFRAVATTGFDQVWDGLVAAVLGPPAAELAIPDDEAAGSDSECVEPTDPRGLTGVAGCAESDHLADPISETEPQPEPGRTVDASLDLHGVSGAPADPQSASLPRPAAVEHGSLIAAVVPRPVEAEARHRQEAAIPQTQRPATVLTIAGREDGDAKGPRPADPARPSAGAHRIEVQIPSTAFSWAEQDLAGLPDPEHPGSLASELIRLPSVPPSSGTVSPARAALPVIAAEPISQLVRAVLSARDGHVHIMLDPEELGAVRLVLLQDGESLLRVHVLAERPETLDLLRRNITDLATELRLSGLGNPSFTFADSDAGDADLVPRSPAGEPDHVGDDSLDPVGAGPVRIVMAGSLDLRL